jgi:hypothetical protein
LTHEAQEEHVKTYELFVK